MLVRAGSRIYDSAVISQLGTDQSTDAADGPAAARWLLLIHQIPRKPDYLRVKIGRRLERTGAVAIKNSIYVLPFSAQALEDFQWILREITEGGGEASICRAEFVDGLTDGEIEQLLRDARVRDYEAIARRARMLLRKVPGGRLPNDDRRVRIEAELTRIRARLGAVSRIDFFDACAGSPAASLVQSVEERLRPARAADPPQTSVTTPRSELYNRVWVTRQGVFVDRIASAWLIRRFIDSEARFKFVAPKSYRPEPGELRFDMAQAEYTHEGDRCTFEMLLRRFRLDDPALSQIAEIVHEIDLRDGKFEREDARGIERVLAGIAAAHPDDASRLERGTALFDELYALTSAELSRAAMLDQRRSQ